MSTKGGKPENLISLATRTTEEKREIAKKGGAKSAEVRREKKLLSAMYADILARGFSVDGERLSLDEVVSAIISQNNSASVSMLKEIREATEGSKFDVNNTTTTPTEFVFVDVPKRKPDGEN